MKKNRFLDKMLNLKNNNALFILLFCLISFGLKARHIIGGEMYYSCVRIDTVTKRVNFLITMKVYRDAASGGALFDDPALVGIYSKQANGTYRFVRKLELPSVSTKKLDYNFDTRCYDLPPNIEVEEGLYTGQTGDLDISNLSYVLVYQRCCRNESISNIIAPGDNGAAYTIEITPEAQRSCNNSPQFKNFPPIVICANQPLKFDHSVVDIDGDVVIYEFCNPIDAGGKRGSSGNGGSPMDCDGVTPAPENCPPPYRLVKFRAPFYSASNPMGGNPIVTINATTGLIFGTPVDQGQFVVGVCAKEYRNGVLLSIIQRDFQFNVTYCAPNVSAKLKSDSLDASGQSYVINSCGNNTITFLNQSTKIENIRSYLWEFDINGNLETRTTRDATITFPGLGKYEGIMYLNRGTICADSAKISVNIYPDIAADFNYKYDTCTAGPVLFTDLSTTGSKKMTNWNWVFGPNGTSTDQNPNFLFNTPGVKAIKLSVKDINGCVADTTRNIDYFPVPPLLIIDPSSFNGCEPMSVFFKNLSVPIDSTYEILWTFGDGGTSDRISPSHVYTTPGVYDVHLSIKSPIGCFIEADYPNWITVRQSPDAGFSYTPSELSSFNKEIFLVDESKNAKTVDWLIDGRIPLFGLNPNYMFRDTGVHEIRQIVIHENGCRDTLIQYIDIEPKVTLFMPNAFTPNGDGTNDLFGGVGIFDGMKEFHMGIWDRWGSLIFETKNPEEGWNGKIKNTEVSVQNGVYVYRISYITPRNEHKKLIGQFNLVR